LGKGCSGRADSVYRADIHAVTSILADSGVNPHRTVFFGDGFVGAFGLAGTTHDADIGIYDMGHFNFLLMRYEIWDNIIVVCILRGVLFCQYDRWFRFNEVLAG
jgi:hypothetical protein